MTIFRSEDWEDVRTGDKVKLRNRQDSRCVIEGVVKENRARGAHDRYLTLLGPTIFAFGVKQWILEEWTTIEREKKVNDQQGPWPGLCLRTGDKITLERKDDDDGETLVTGRISTVTPGHIRIAKMSTQFFPDWWKVTDHTPGPKPLPTIAGLYVWEGTDLARTSEVFRLSPGGVWSQFRTNGERMMSNESMRIMLQDRKGLRPLAYTGGDLP